MNDLLMLAMLLDGPKYGYQLKREAGWITGQGPLHNNLVYPMLRRFLEQRWVSQKEAAGERGQTRLQYALTAEGKRYLFGRMNEFGAADAASEEAFNLRVGLFGALQSEVRERILAMREEFLRGRDQKLAALEKNMDLGQFGTEIVKHMRKQVEMDAEWVRHLRRVAGSAAIRRQK